MNIPKLVHPMYAVPVKLVTLKGIVFISVTWPWLKHLSNSSFWMTIRVQVTFLWIYFLGWVTSSNEGKTTEQLLGDNLSFLSCLLNHPWKLLSKNSFSYMQSLESMSRINAWFLKSMTVIWISIMEGLSLHPAHYSCTSYLIYLY